MAASQGAVIELRPLASHDELREAVRLQKEIWGFEELELLPVRLFVVATKVGGQTFGAFDGSRMIGFLLAIPGIKAGKESYLHSHMMGVLPGYRDGGVGRRLKLMQRDDALARGIRLVEWTFDPLEIKNAWFNIERLGAVVRRYVLNQYGTTSSHLHGGLPTDRCVAEWYVASPRVERVLGGGSGAGETEITERIEVPANIGELRRTDPRSARAIQAAISERFCDLFSAGLAVVGIERTSEATVYLLGQWESESTA